MRAAWIGAWMGMSACGGDGKEAGPGPGDDDDATAGDDDDTTTAPGDDDDTTTAGDDDDDTPPTEPPPCLGVGFSATATDWSLPDPGFRDDAAGGPGLDAVGGFESVACGRDRYASHAVLDLTGDGVPDLVFTRNDCLDPRIGREVWVLYEGAPSGFAAVGREYALPPAAYDDVAGNPPLDVLGSYEEMDCGGRLTHEYVSWSVFDLTGDGLLDLVRFRDDCDDPAAGTDHWDVFEGGAAGFASLAIEWSLPAGHPDPAGNPPYETAGAYEEVDCAGPFGQEYVAWGVLDLTGDGVPDLVRTRDDCDDPDVGTDHWAVFAGGARGFDRSPTPWSLPPGHPDLAGDPPYDALGGYEEKACGGPLAQEYVAWSLLDVTGDGVPDLVHARDDCDDPTAGTDHWAVFVGGAAGFAATSTRWSLPPADPDVSGNPPYDSPSGYDERDCGGPFSQEYVSWSTRDLTGDAVPDLVHFRDDCGDPAAGTDHWAVFEGGPSGFAGTSTAWALPPGSPDFGGNPPYDGGGNYEEWDCGGRFTAEYVSYTTIDLTGDGLLDLVFVRDDCTDPEAIGRERWVVHAAECEPPMP